MPGVHLTSGLCALVACGSVLAIGWGHPAGSSAQVPGTADAELPAVLLSRPVMEAEGLSIGDVVRLSASPAGTAPRSFRVAGVYEPVPDPFRITTPRLEARLHLPDLHGLTIVDDDPLAPETVTAINVALRDAGEAASVTRAVGSRVPGLVAHRTDQRGPGARTFVVLERFHWAIAVVTLVGSAMFLLALMVMVADERRELVGVLRLIGLSRRRILLQVLIEGALIAGAGAVAGLAIAVASQGAINGFFQWRYDTALVFVRVTPAIAAQTVALAVPLGVMASLAASWGLLRRSGTWLARR